MMSIMMTIHSILPIIMGILLPILVTHALAGETVDIAQEMQGHKCTVISQDHNETSFTIYSRMPRVHISRVVCHDKVLWETDQEDILYHHFTVYRLFKKPLIGYLYFTDARRFHYVHFKFEDGQWIRVDRVEYQRLMEKMQNERPLDVRAPDTLDLVKMEEYAPFGITARIYMNKSKYRIGSVVDGPQVLWESKSWEERCEHVVIHGHPANPKLVHMFIKLAESHNVLYFDQRDGEWTMVEKDAFFAKLEELDNEHDGRAECVSMNECEA